jgi:putative glutamine amidotransferase
VTRPPRIAVTLSAPGRTAEPEVQRRKNELYLRAVVRAGGDPAPLDTATPAAERDLALASMDGLLLSGGPDLDPALYGEEAAGAAMIDPERDALDVAAWHAASNRRIPVLGLCRGFQAINVFMGGRLAQHLEGHRPPPGTAGAVSHPLRVRPGSRLAELLRLQDAGGHASDHEDAHPGRSPAGSFSVTVNSSHHQGVRPGTLARALMASGWSLAGDQELVEAFEFTDPAWFVLGVQCHPERTETTPPEFARLFAAFVGAAHRGSRAP